jgi:hypothetical protein
MDEVNNMHRSGMVMETEPIALKRIRSLQDVTRSVLLVRPSAWRTRTPLRVSSRTRLHSLTTQARCMLAAHKTRAWKGVLG